jgi:CBS domain-containing protein
VLTAGTNRPIVAYPDELVHDAMHSMMNHDIGWLPVVARDDPQKMVGYFTRSSILTAWSRQAQDEGVREPGWINRWRQEFSRNSR